MSDFLDMIYGPETNLVEPNAEKNYMGAEAVESTNGNVPMKKSFNHDKTLNVDIPTYCLLSSHTRKQPLLVYFGEKLLISLDTVEISQPNPNTQNIPKLSGLVTLNDIFETNPKEAFLAAYGILQTLGSRGYYLHTNDVLSSIFIDKRVDNNELVMKAFGLESCNVMYESLTDQNYSTTFFVHHAMLKKGDIIENMDMLHMKMKIELPTLATTTTINESIKHLVTEIGTAEFVRRLARQFITTILSRNRFPTLAPLFSSSQDQYPVLLTLLLIDAVQTVKGKNCPALQGSVYVLPQPRGVNEPLLEIVAHLNLLSMPGSRLPFTLLVPGNYSGWGEDGVEVLLVLLSLKALFPQHVILLRGAADCRVESTNFTASGTGSLILSCKRFFPGDMVLNSSDMLTFSREVMTRSRIPTNFISEVENFHFLKVWESFNSCFDTFPLAATVNSNILVVSGGPHRNIHHMTKMQFIESIEDIPCPTKNPFSNVKARDTLLAHPFIENKPDSKHRLFQPNLDSPGTIYFTRQAVERLGAIGFTHILTGTSTSFGLCGDATHIGMNENDNTLFFIHNSKIVQSIFKMTKRYVYPNLPDNR